MSMRDQPEPVYEAAPVFDNLDIDLFVKVASWTIFSPFFTAFLPIFYIFQGMAVTHPIVLGFIGYCLAICVFWFVKWHSLLYRNQGSLLYGPGPFDWGEQTVLITGGASGIGELLANTLAVRNVSVVVLDVKPIQTENYNITYYKCDVSKWEEVEAVSKVIAEEVGHPTVIVNNAGVVQGKGILELSEADVNQTFGVNTLAHFWILKAFLPEMIKEKTGHIITMSSVMGLVGAARMTDYCASKAALVSLHESLRYDLDRTYNTPDIRTTLMIPGHTMTTLFANAKLPRWGGFFKFFIPSLHPVGLVKEIIKTLDNKHSTVIALPFYVNLVPFISFLPSFARDFCQWLSGADEAMADFVKVSGRRPEEGPAPQSVGTSKYE